MPRERDLPRHSAVVRVTHWINFLSFAGLAVSGIAILLAHPRLYWGETGSVGVPSLIDLPLPFVLTGQSGWGRALHFQSAWACVLNGLVYVLSGVATRHFRCDLLPAGFSWSAFSWVVARPLRFTHGDEPSGYNLLQRLIYSGVVFVLFPLAIWTGLAMSPSVTSVFPSVVELLGGQQSARTMHFFLACALGLFLFVHIAMVCAAGFPTLRAMITGRPRRGAAFSGGRAAFTGEAAEAAPSETAAKKNAAKENA